MNRSLLAESPLSSVTAREFGGEMLGGRGPDESRRSAALADQTLPGETPVAVTALDTLPITSASGVATLVKQAPEQACLRTTSKVHFALQKNLAIVASAARMVRAFPPE